MGFRIRNHKLSFGGANVDFVNSPNVGGALQPRFLVMHYTAGGPDFDTAAFFSRESAKVSAHLVIRRDGTVIQCVPFNVIGFHAGRSSWTARDGSMHDGLNKSSIGIEMENWGPLKKTGSGWVSWTGAAVDPSKVIEARHKFGTPDCGWEIFSEAQTEAAIGVAGTICAEYGIEEIVGHDDIAPGRKQDPGPAWNMSSFLARVFGRGEDAPSTFVIASPEGLNLRTGAGAGNPKVREDPLPDGTRVLVHEAEGQWRFISVLDNNGVPTLSGWVHGAFLRMV